MQGLEQLATVSATCFLRTFHHLSVMDPSSSVLEDVRQRYNRVFLPETDFRRLPFYYTMIKIHSLANRTLEPSSISSGVSVDHPLRNGFQLHGVVAEAAQDRISTSTA
jgi:hypothetical protein